MSEKLFYKNAFALVVELRSTSDPNVFNMRDLDAELLKGIRNSIKEWNQRTL